jgi:D-aminoacyl-tRNA deacylase
MRAVVQRVSRARVTVESSVTGEITTGLMILLGIGRDDTPAVAVSMAEKVANLRIFEDDQGKMNRSLLDVGGSALVVSQFTLYGDARGQRRPSFYCCCTAGTGKEALRRVQRSAAQVGSHRSDRSFPGDDVSRIGQ